MAHADANCRDGELDPLEEDEQGDFGKDLPPWSHLSFQADLVPLPSEVPLDRAGRVARALNRADRDRLRC